MKVYLAQGTKLWHEWRSGGVGGSDAAAIMNCSPYTRKSDLFAYKTGAKMPPKFPEYLSKKGHAKEIIGRQFAEAMMGCTFNAACFQSDQHEFIRSSLDGISPDKTIIFENKYVGAKAFTEQCEKTEIPKHHYWQIVQAFIAVPTATHGYYVVVNDSNKCYGVIVERKESDCEILKANVIAFWQAIQSGELLIDDDPDIVDLSANNEFSAAVADYLNLSKQIKELTKRRDEAQAVVLNLADKKTSTCAAGRVKFFEQQGAIDYKKLLKAFDIDGESYRKPPTIRQRISANEE